MSALTGFRRQRLTAAVVRGTRMAEDAMTQTCTIEENQITAGGQDDWVAVASDVPCRITLPNTGIPFALSESTSYVFEHIGNWHVHVPISQTVNVGARITCGGIHYLITGQQAQKTYPVERVLLATSLHTPGTPLP